MTPEHGSTARVREDARHAPVRLRGMIVKVLDRRIFSHGVPFAWIRGRDGRRAWIRADALEEK